MGYAVPDRAVDQEDGGATAGPAGAGFPDGEGMAETTEIRLPRLADSVTTVRFGAWLKREGDRVAAGEPVAEVETDKTTVEIEAPAAGVLRDLRVAPGADGLEVGAILGRIAAPAGGPADASPLRQAETPSARREAGAPGRSEPGAVEPGPEPAAGAVSDETPAAPGAAPAMLDKPPATPGEPLAAPDEAPVGEAPAGEAPAPAATPLASRMAAAGISESEHGRRPAPAATPLARRMAAAAGLDLSAVRAGDPDGRIRKADVDRALAERRGASGEASAPSARVALPGGGVTTPAAPAGDRASTEDGRGSSAAAQVEAASPSALPPSQTEAGAWGDAEPPHHEPPLTGMRRVTATRMQQAKQTVPHFYLRAECRVDAALGFLAAAKRQLPDAPPTLTDLVVRAAAFALRAVPEANSAWVDDAVRVYERVDIAVAVDTSQGLVAPVVRGADGMDLGSIARETRDLAARAREGSLAPAEYSGGTFTVSNLGMHGVESLYAIVNPPQSCILGVGAATRRAVADGDGVGVGTVMACTLSADHRVIDGAAGARLLDTLRSCLEQPGLMLLQTEGVSAPAGRRGAP